jgi:hypothetical protein
MVEEKNKERTKEKKKKRKKQKIPPQHLVWFGLG